VTFNDPLHVVMAAGSIFWDGTVPQEKKAVRSLERIFLFFFDGGLLVTSCCFLNTFFFKESLPFCDAFFGWSCKST